jgi:hypothetical protein
MPTDDWSGQSTEVQALCNLFHTAEAIEAAEAVYNVAQANNLPGSE